MPLSSLLALLACVSAFGPPLSAAPLGAAFTYHGRLVDNSQPATGSYDLRFTLYGVPAGGLPLFSDAGAAMRTNAATEVSNGLFTVTVDFGSGLFNGDERWLEIGVRPNGSLGEFITLNPRQQLTATPYALNTPGAGTAATALTTVAGSVNNLSLAPGAVTSDKISDGSIVAADLNPALVSSTFWRLGGNAGTTPGTHFLGTTDNQALELRINGLRVQRFADNGDSTSDGDNIPDGAPNVMEGSPANVVGVGVVGATISGGGATNFGGNAASANTALANYATIGGGVRNRVEAGASMGTLGGGWNNTIQTDAFLATVGGGYGNTIQAGADYATIPGGLNNSAASYAFAAGHRAKANHTGAFVWADSTAADFASTTADQFSIRASGGVRLSDDTPALSFGSTARQMINLYGMAYAIGIQSGTVYQRSAGRFSWFKGGMHSNTQNDPGTGGSVLMTLVDSGLTVNGTFVSTSDRNAKEAFEPVNPGEILDQVIALPLSRWTYRTDEQRTRHLGPVAQDFHAAFGVGPDDRHIATVDADGVALAAIQGLNKKVEVRGQRSEDRIQRLEVENAELTARLERLERLLLEDK